MVLVIFKFLRICNGYLVILFPFDCQANCNDQSEKDERPGVIISNHVSHMDILYHMSSSFPSFVAKVGLPVEPKMLYEILVVYSKTYFC